MRNLIFVLGAGATYNEGLEENVEESKLPPLDKKFFSKYELKPDIDSIPIKQHLNDIYGIDIFKGEYNSLEKRS